MTQDLDWCCVAAVNDERVLELNLAASPALRAAPERLRIERGHSTAGAAYNSGLDATTAPIVVFAHQDVYFPKGWERALAHGLDRLAATDPDWAVAGLVGMLEEEYTTTGHAWCSGLGCEVGAPFQTPRRVVSLDEIVLVLRRDSGLRFDPDLPSFHLYGTDIVQSARAAHRGAWLIDAPAIHNTVPVTTLGGGFTEAYRYMQCKWWDILPIRTPITEITRTGLYHWKRRLQIWRRGWARSAQILRARSDRLAGRPDPGALARRLGYEDYAGVP
jgi:hypothetical protein